MTEDEMAPVVGVRAGLSLGFSNQELVLHARAVSTWPPVRGGSSAWKKSSGHSSGLPEFTIASPRLTASG